MWRSWTSDDISKLKSLAGRLPAPKVASELGRGLSATKVKAHQLSVSMRYKPTRQPDSDPGPLVPKAGQRAEGR